MTPAAKLVWYVVGIGIAGTAALSTLPLWHSQTRNMMAVQKWHDEAQPKIYEFAKREQLKLKVFTFPKQQGSVGVRIDEPKPDTVEKTKAFVRSLNPPRPVHYQVQQEGLRYTTTIDDPTSSSQ